MDLYTQTAYRSSRLLTEAYSTSFGLSIRLFQRSLRHHAYGLYGLVRIADEIVDTYQGKNQRHLLDTLEKEVADAIEHGYSTNPIVHAFALTAREYAIDKHLIDPFFESMRMDITKKTAYTKRDYQRYIHGSAEVVGLMLLRILVDDDMYRELSDGARRLGAAYQKVNFLRDLAADHAIKRWYFPFASYETFSEDDKQAIIEDIAADFAASQNAMNQLPESGRKAVTLSYEYYHRLLEKIVETPAATLKTTRIRVPDTKKLALLAKVKFSRVDS